MQNPSESSAIEEDIMDGFTVDQWMANHEEAKGVESYTLGKIECDNQQEFQKHWSQCRIPLAGVTKKTILFPAFDPKKWATKQAFDDYIQEINRELRTIPGFPLGEFVVVLPQLKTLVITKMDGFNYNRKDPRQLDYYTIVVYNFILLGRIKYKGDTYFGSVHEWKFTLYGDVGRTLATRIQSGDPFVLIHTEVFKGNKTTDLFEINEPSAEDLKGD